MQTLTSWICGLWWVKNFTLNFSCWWSFKFHVAMSFVWLRQISWPWQRREVVGVWRGGCLRYSNWLAGVTMICAAGRWLSGIALQIGCAGEHVLIRTSSEFHYHVEICFAISLFWNILKQTTHCIDFLPVTTNRCNLNPCACSDRLNLQYGMGLSRAKLRSTA